MKTQLVSLNDFSGHPHPASKLFRAIELKTIHENCQNMSFKQPSVDLGCGDGYISSILFDERFTYGVDNGEAHDVYVAIRKKIYKKVLIESAEKMSIKTNSINFVFSNSVIEHIPDIDAVLYETARILKKSGVFIFTSPSHLFVKYLSRFPIVGNFYAQKRNQMLNHYHLYSHKKWVKKLARYGLKVTKYKYYISKDCLVFWDKLAIEVRIKSIFDKRAEQNTYKKYYKKILFYFENDFVTNDRGASLFIYAVKI